MGSGGDPPGAETLLPETPRLPLPISAAPTGLRHAVAVVLPRLQPYPWLLHAFPSTVGTHAFRDKPSLHGGHLQLVPGPQLHAVRLAFRKAGFTESHTPPPLPTAPGVCRPVLSTLHPAGGRPPALGTHDPSPPALGTHDPSLSPKGLPSHPLKSFHALPLCPQNLSGLLGVHPPA